MHLAKGGSIMRNNTSTTLSVPVKRKDESMYLRQHVLAAEFDDGEVTIDTTAGISGQTIVIRVPGSLFGEDHTHQYTVKYSDLMEAILVHEGVIDPMGAQAEVT
jgi:hypothetical protein